MEAQALVFPDGRKKTVWSETVCFFVFSVALHYFALTFHPQYRALYALLL